MRILTLKITIVFLAFLRSSAAVYAETPVATYTGSGNQLTREFEVQAPWILRWRVGSNFPQATVFELALMDAVTSYQHSRIMRIKTTGSGTKLFEESGRFRFSVSSSFADWNLRVIELSDAEAAEFVPKKRFGPAN